MYKLTLILKYLRRKLGPMFAALAVMLCTLMVICVISVMGGFLDMLRVSASQLTGDVTVRSSITGFAHYEELVDRLSTRPEVEAVSPVIEMFGMVNIGGETKGVRIMGIDPATFSCIVPYEQTLHWDAEDLAKSMSLLSIGEIGKPPSFDPHAMGMTLDAFGANEKTQGLPSMVIGIEVNPYQSRDEQGQYDFLNSAVPAPATLTLLPLTERGAPAEMGPVYAKTIIVNEFKSGLYEVDQGQVFVHFDVLQKLLDMDREEGDIFDPQSGDKLPGKSIRPARATEVLVAGKDGYTLAQVRAAVSEEVNAFASAHLDVFPPRVFTWEEIHAQFISAVENEKGMVTFLFAIIGMVAVVMVGTTLYMTVLEKTRDIGVLRAVGASQAGIIGMYLGYGLAVGTVGAIAGLIGGTLVVTRINDIQYWLAHYLGVSMHFAWCATGVGLLGWIIGGIIGFKRRRFLKYAFVYAVLSGAAGLIVAWVALLVMPDLGPRLNEMIRFEMWNPQLYYFDRIPDTVKFSDALFIVLGAIAASAVGALIPAIIAAEQDPVESLRYE